ncbi:MAG TPA: sodium:proton antiporter [Steroidobacteraceae bacterium]|jgi:CPA1 family monovalent cation:H+ antiporter|nr:sodium:proton antiporter [Steroidobacteraceae bacterium]
MQLFVTMLALLLGATALSAVAKRLNIPYPTVLAVGGGIAAFIPGTSQFDLPPDLILALFVAPVLLDAAYDASLRDLRKNGPTILSLVLMAVGLTTVTVAVTARLLFPEMPWAAAVALGALLAPPDAVAALAVLRQVHPPHRIRMVLEGESLLNDASALLIYRLAVGAVAVGGFDAVGAIPMFGVVVLGSVVAGWLLSWPAGWLIRRIDDAPSNVIVQFVITFGVWLAAEYLHLSGVVTIVVFAMTLARRQTTPARVRIPSFAIWETMTFVLNVLAFTLIGLQVRPTFLALSGAERQHYLLASLVILVAVIGIRIIWVLMHHLLAQWRPHPETARSAKGAVVIAWSGMRGIVTLAAAMALPGEFPYRDFIELTAFVVVLGTLVIQGMTLGPLLALLRMPRDSVIDSELHAARKAALQAALNAIDGDESPAAQRLRLEYGEALSQARHGRNPRDRLDNVLRQRAIAAGRTAISELRSSDAIGDDAYRRMEEELDWLELSSRPARTDG